RSKGYPKAVTPWFEFTDLMTTGHGPQQPIAVTYVDASGPITRGLKDWTTTNEELYNNFTGKLLDTARPLARGKQIVRAKTGKGNGPGAPFAELALGKARVIGYHRHRVCGNSRRPEKGDVQPFARKVPSAARHPPAQAGRVDEQRRAERQAVPPGLGAEGRK